MRKIIKKSLAVFLMIITAVTAVACNKEQETDNGTKTKLTPKEVKAALEEQNYQVQEGKLYELDCLEEASKGKLLSCFGNNQGSAYMVLDLPDAPNQEVKNPDFLPKGMQYKLREDEAIVMIGTLPPECKYFSFENYIMFTEQKEGKDYSKELGYFPAGNKEVGLYHPIFSSIGDSINMLRIKHEDENKQVFNDQAVIVISMNKITSKEVIDQLVKAGYPETMINLMEIPSTVYKTGLEKGADTFTFLGRLSQPADKDEYKNYMENLSKTMSVYRVTPNTEKEKNPYVRPAVITRGNGVNEVSILKNAEKNLEKIRKKIISKYADGYDYEELDSNIAVQEGATAYLNDRNAQGDIRDTAYIMTRDFTLNSDDDFIVMYGVNHTKTGKAVYSNCVLYARPMLNGVATAFDSLFEGSAAPYLDDKDEDTDNYYVYKFARTKMDDKTTVIEYSTGNEKGKYYGVDNGNPLLVAYRAYVDKTGVGPDYNEIIYDRAIVFHKKK